MAGRPPPSLHSRNLRRGHRTQRTRPRVEGTFPVARSDLRPMSTRWRGARRCSLLNGTDRAHGRHGGRTGPPHRFCQLHPGRWPYRLQETRKPLFRAVARAPALPRTHPPSVAALAVARNRETRLSSPTVKSSLAAVRGQFTETQQNVPERIREGSDVDSQGLSPHRWRSHYLQ